jgi:hypothetical protein
MATGFAISLRLVDLATKPILNVNQAITALEKNTKRAAREGGLFEIKDALGKIRREGAAVADSLSSVFTPLGGLTAAGSLAGMAALARHFATAGAEVARTSKLFDASTDDLQTWRGAARLAGGAAGRCDAGDLKRRQSAR